MRAMFRACARIAESSCEMRPRGRTARIAYFSMP
jgi:hypothetical protein